MPVHKFLQIIYMICLMLVFFAACSPAVTSVSSHASSPSGLTPSPRTSGTPAVPHPSSPVSATLSASHTPCHPSTSPANPTVSPSGTATSSSPSKIPSQTASDVSLPPSLPVSQPAASPKPTSSVKPSASPRPSGHIDYRQEMRLFVQSISQYAKGRKTDFIVVPQNGEDIVKDGAIIHQDYFMAIDGIGREDFLYGYTADNTATPDREMNAILKMLEYYQQARKTILITDYCSTKAKMTDSYATNQRYGFVSFAADERELNSIPAFPNPIFNENANPVRRLADVQNFLYLINPERYSTKAEFIKAIAATNYDLVIIDLFFNEEALTAADLAKIRVKQNGAARLAIAYMSIGEAEDYRYYWQANWTQQPPSWLGAENPEWEGNFKVAYWDPGWQAIIRGKSGSYTAIIIDAGFDGVYLDLIDAYEYFE